MKKKSMLIVVGLLTVAIGLFWWISRSKKSNAENLKPTLSIATISISNIDNDKINMNTKVVIKNPLPVDLNSKNLNYDLLINGKKVLSNTYNKPISIQSNDSSVIEMPMEVLVKPLTEVLKNIDQQNADSADYTLNASMALDLPVAGERMFDFAQTERLPSFQIPKVKPEDIDVKKLRWNASTLTMDFTIENPNAYPFKMKDMKYNVTLGNDMLMEGVVAEYTIIPAKGATKVPVPLTIKNKELGQLMWKTLFDKDDTPFAVDFSCKLESETKLLDNSTIAMKTNGTLKDIKKVAKKTT